MNIGILAVDSNFPNLALMKISAYHKEWKNILKKKAQQLFPYAKVTLATSDALLICEYGRIKEKE